MIPVPMQSSQPLPQTAIDIPQQSYVPLKNPMTGIETHKAECARCRKGLYEKDIVKQLQCGHLFHGHCIDNHLRVDIYCPVCRMQVLFPTAVPATIVHEGRAARSVYPSAKLPPRTEYVATAFVPSDGTNRSNYAPCRECGQMFYRDLTKVRPETNAWYRCEQCAPTDIIDFIRGSCAVQVSNLRGKSYMPRIRNNVAVELRSRLTKGDWIDVLDCDGVWNVARVLSVPSSEEVEITYDGWTKEYDEIVKVESDRVAPYHTFTWTVKCWVKYLNWPLWPSLVTIRTPGTPAGIRNLAAEHRLQVDFFDSPNFAKRDRCWQKKLQIQRFNGSFSKKRMGSTGAQFEQALARALQSNASTEMPKFADGTLPIEYKISPATSVKAARKRMGDECWLQSFSNNQTLHKKNHVYEVLGDKDHSDDSDESSEEEVTVNDQCLNLLTSKGEPKKISNGKKQPSSTSSKLKSSRSKIKDPKELEMVAKSDLETNCNGNSTKKRLRTNRPTSDMMTSRAMEPTQNQHFESTQQQINLRVAGRHVKEKRSGQRQLMNRNEKATLNDKNTLEAPVQNLKARRKMIDNEPSDRSFDSTSSNDILKRANKRPRSDSPSQHRGLAKEKNFATTRRKALKHRPSLLLLNTNETSLSSSRRMDKNNACQPRDMAKPIVSYANKDKKTSNRKHLTTLNSTLSAETILSSDQSGPDDGNKIGRGQRIIEEDTSMQKKSNHHAVIESLAHQMSPASQNNSFYRYDDADASQRHQQFCLMKADKAGADDLDKVRLSKRTAISVPKKFDSTSTLHMRTCHTNTSMIRLRPPPRIFMHESRPRTHSALPSRSTPIFSSSKGFSVESWFKRNSMANSMDDYSLSKN